MILSYSIYSVAGECMYIHRAELDRHTECMTSCNQNAHSHTLCYEEHIRLHGTRFQYIVRR